MAGKLDLSMYPPRLRDGFHKGAMYWPLVVQAAKEIGYKHLDQLTDLVFHMHHPELKGRAIHPGEAALITEWNAHRALIKPTIDSTPKGPSLQKLLADAELKAPGVDAHTLAQRSMLRAYLVRAMGGEKIDDEYAAYKFRDHAGGTHASWELDNVQALERTGRRHVVKQFETKAAGASTPHEAGLALSSVEKDLFHNMNVVLRWAIQACASIAAMKGAPEYGYLEEMHNKAMQTEPESVYLVYQRKILVTYRNVHSPSPWWKPWPVMPQ